MMWSVLMTVSRLTTPAMGSADGMWWFPFYFQCLDLAVNCLSEFALRWLAWLAGAPVKRLVWLSDVVVKWLVWWAGVAFELSFVFGLMAVTD